MVILEKIKSLNKETKLEDYERERLNKAIEIVESDKIAEIFKKDTLKKGVKNFDLLFGLYEKKAKKYISDNKHNYLIFKDLNSLNEMFIMMAFFPEHIAEQVIYSIQREMNEEVENEEVENEQ